MVSQTLPDALRRRPRVISEELNNARQPRKRRVGFIDFPMPEGLLVDPNPPRRLPLEQSKIESSLLQVVT
jgi:hypothetical protein